MRGEIRALIIIGSGPAGLTAALYAARAGLKPLVLAGATPGGQLMLTTKVENYPGFEHGILGPELMSAMRTQAEAFGIEYITGDVTSVDFTGKPLTVTSGTATYQTRAVIIATGARTKWLGLPNEERFIGKGVSSCAVCDAFFFRNKQVIVVGGGDTAMEDALTLTKFATSVTIVHRRHEFRASRIMQERALAHPKITVLWDSVVSAIVGEEKVTGVVVTNVTTHQEKELATAGLFVAIGFTPATGFLKGQVELDEKGYVQRFGEAGTSVPGVFLAGDVEDYRYRQAVTAAGQGCKAALDAERFLETP